MKKSTQNMNLGELQSQLDKAHRNHKVARGNLARAVAAEVRAADTLSNARRLFDDATRGLLASTRMTES